MLAGIASLVFIPLLTITFAHLIWVFGLTWPAKNRELLAQTVTGRQTMQPRLVSLLVAIFVFASGLWALSLSDPEPNGPLIAGGLVLALIYGARGVAGFLPAWQNTRSAEPFATFNRKLYAPLCLGIAAGFLLLTALNAF